MQETNASAQQSWWDMTPEEVRTKINQRIMSIEAATPLVDSIENRKVNRSNRSTNIRLYKPGQGKNFPIILFIHGGAWVAGNLDTHDNLARYLCRETQSMVVSIGYLNSPEGKFPIPLEQCYDVLLWIKEHAHEFSTDHSKIAVVGDSAGGNLAAALCLMARDRSGPKIDLQVLINPALDLTCNGTLSQQHDALDTLRWQVVQYLSDPRDAHNPYVSPLMSKDLSGLPVAVIILAEHDELRESGQKYAESLQAAGIPTLVFCQKGGNHLAGYGARAADVAHESLNFAVEAMQKLFFDPVLIPIENPWNAVFSSIHKFSDDFMNE